MLDVTKIDVTPQEFNQIRIGNKPYFLSRNPIQAGETVVIYANTSVSNSKSFRIVTSKGDPIALMAKVTFLEWIVDKYVVSVTITDYLNSMELRDI